MALPPNSLTTPATEFIGLLTCTTPTAASTGWCGLSLGGGMVNAPLLLAYPSPTAADPNRVLTSFRWAASYGPPTLYTGPAALSQISSTVNATHFSVLFRCVDCLAWKQGETTGQVSTAEGMLVLGWAHHAAASPSNAACADSARVGQHAQQGMFGAVFTEGAVNAKYQEWTGLAKGSVKGECGGPATTTASVVTTRLTALPGVETGVVLLPTGTSDGGVMLPPATSEGGVMLPPATSEGGVMLPPGTTESGVMLPPATTESGVLMPSGTPVRGTIIRASSETGIIIQPTYETPFIISPTTVSALPPIIATSVVQLPPASSRPSIALPTASKGSPILTLSKPSIVHPTAPKGTPIWTAPKPSIALPTAPKGSPILTVPKPSVPKPSIALPTAPKGSPILTVPKPSIWIPTTIILPTGSPLPTVPKPSIWIPTTPVPRPTGSPIPTVPKPSIWIPTTLIPRPSPSKTTKKPVIVLPTRTRTPTVPTPKLGRCRKTYKVVRGDYCWLIATEVGMTLERFYKLNPEVECQPLQIGEVVCLRRG